MSQSDEKEPKKVSIRAGAFTVAAVITAIDFIPDGDLDIYNGIRQAGVWAIDQLT